MMHPSSDNSLTRIQMKHFLISCHTFGCFATNVVGSLPSGLPQLRTHSPTWFSEDPSIVPLCLVGLNQAEVYSKWTANDSKTVVNQLSRSFVTEILDTQTHTRVAFKEDSFVDEIKTMMNSSLQKKNISPTFACLSTQFLTDQTATANARKYGWDQAPILATALRSANKLIAPR